MNQSLYFNASQFFFKIQGIPDDSLSVLEFRNSTAETGTEPQNQHGLSEDYCFVVTLYSEHVLDVGSLINKDAFLIWALDAGGNQKIHGVITRVQAPKLTLGGYEYCLHMHSPLFRLKLNFPSRVYTQKNVLSIIDDVLQSAHWHKGTQGNYQIQSSRNYPLLACEVQLEKSDFHFMTQLMHRWGLFYYFEDVDGLCRLNIVDDIQFLPTDPSMPTPEISLHEWSSWQVLTHSHHCADYNSDNPTVPLQIKTQSEINIASEGGKYVYGENFRTVAEGEQLSHITQQALDWQRDICYATSICRTLKPGDTVGEYLVVNVSHTGDQRGAFYGKQSDTHLRYHNTLTLIKKGIAYHPKKEQRHYSPAHVGTLETFGDTGSYTFRFPFDQKNPEGLGSPNTHQLQPLSGGGKEVGFHFPNQKGTQTEIIFMNGDINRPVLSGALFEGPSHSPVTSNNPSQHRLLTKSENELRFDDERNKEFILLTTHHQKNFLSLSACPNNEKVCLKTMEGKLYLSAGLHALWETEGDTLIDVGKNYNTKVKNNHQVIANENIRWSSEKDMHFRSKQNLSFVAEQKMLAFNSQENIFIDSEQCNIQFEKQNSTIQALEGNVTFKAKNFVQARANKTMRIAQAGAAVSLSDNKIKLNTPGTLKKGSKAHCQLKGAQKRA